MCFLSAFSILELQFLFLTNALEMSKLLKNTSRIRDKQENTYLGFNNNFLAVIVQNFCLPSWEVAHGWI